MGVALYVTLEREIDGLDHFMGGKALAWAPVDEYDEGGLADVAHSLDVTPLHEFFSSDPEQIIGMMFDGDPADAPDEIRNKVPRATWFPASEGVRTARALREYLQANPHILPVPDRINWDFQEGVMEDLKDIERILERADTEGVRWYLAVDC